MSIINLLPDNYIKQRMQRRIDLACLGLFVIVISSVLGAYMVTNSSRQNTLRVLERVNAEYDDATKLIENMQILEQQKQQMIEKAKATASIVEKVPRSTLLAIITNARPKGTSLLELNLNTKMENLPKKRLGRMSPSGQSILSTASRTAGEVEPQLVVKITIEGMARTDTQVAKFISNLSANNLVESVDLNFSQEKIIDDIALREFQIDVRLKPNADAIDTVNNDGDENLTAIPLDKGKGAA